MHLFTLYAIIKATSPMSLIASLVASSNLFCIILYLSIAVLFAGNKSTTTITTTVRNFVWDLYDNTQGIRNGNAKLKQVQWDLKCATSFHVYRWLSERLQYLQCVNNGDTAGLH